MDRTVIIFWTDSCVVFIMPALFLLMYSPADMKQAAPPKKHKKTIAFFNFYPSCSLSIRSFCLEAASGSASAIFLFPESF